MERIVKYKQHIGLFAGFSSVAGKGGNDDGRSTALAKNFGVSGLIIGLTIVEPGTSLPELVTSVVAARKGETGLAVENVIGSNIFNLMFILGISAAKP